MCSYMHLCKWYVSVDISLKKFCLPYSLQYIASRICLTEGYSLIKLHQHVKISF